MKTIVSICSLLLAAHAASAQVLRPEAVNGAVVGGIAGAVIGNNSGSLGHNAWKGAAIGAGAGLIGGQMIGNHNAAVRNHQPARVDYVRRDSPVVYAGYRSGYRGYYGHHDYGRRGWYGYGPSYSLGYYPGYGYDYPYYSTGYGSYAGNGLFWGGLAGAIIGNNSGSLHHDAWRGAAWGAGLGWLLGTVADANRPVYTYPTYSTTVQPAPTVQAQPAAAAQPQQITIINNYYNAPATPMSAANGMFGR